MEPHVYVYVCWPCDLRVPKIFSSINENIFMLTSDPLYGVLQIFKYSEEKVKSGVLYINDYE